jgi:hypothetical protein
MVMRELCHTKQEVKTHGLGLILKKPKNDFKRMNILSRHIAIHEGRPIVVRMISRLILTNSTKSNNLTTDEAHFLAAMSLFSFATDPLSTKMIDIRVKMISNVASLDFTQITAEFRKDRMYKLGLTRAYTTQ